MKSSDDIMTPLFDIDEKEKVKILGRILKKGDFKKENGDYLSDKVKYIDITLVDGNDIFLKANRVSFNHNSVRQFMGSVYFLIEDLVTVVISIDAIKRIETGNIETAEELIKLKVNKNLIKIAEDNERMIKKLLDK